MLDDFGRAILDEVDAVSLGALPDPASAGNLDDLIERLRLLKVWGGDPSYEIIKERVNAAWTGAGRPASELARRSTVANAFQRGRRRMNTDLVLAIVEALHPDVSYVTQWRQALRVIAGETEAVAQVRVQESLPDDLAGFTGRTAELDRVRLAARAGGAVVISAIEGMAGVGKTQLAIHAGHLLLRENEIDQVLLVNLRGFHPDPAQPPADPSAVLDGFLRLLGVPGQQIPHDLDGRVAAYRERLAGRRALVVLDNAADPEQVRPLLPATPGCLALVTSRRSLAGLDSAIRLSVDVFTPEESVAFLTAAVPGVPVGTDPRAVARIARRCGHLPLALSLIAGHIRNRPGWTLTDHADRLDDRDRDRRMDSGVELALDLSYRHLPVDQQRLLRLASLHPGPDLGVYAAAALLGSDLPAAQASLDALRADHLLQQTAPGRYVFHDLVRAYANTRAHDEDRPADRRAALTRLFDHYLTTARAAMRRTSPGDSGSRPDPPSAAPAPDLADPATAYAWLDAERLTLVAVCVHAATQGWPDHTVRLSRILARYLSAGHTSEALTVHNHALQAARRTEDLAGQAHALRLVGGSYLQMAAGSDLVTEYFQQALELFRRLGDVEGQAITVHNLHSVAEQNGRYGVAMEHLLEALRLVQQSGDRLGEGYTMCALGDMSERLGRYLEAIEYQQRAVALCREIDSPYLEAYALTGMGLAEAESGLFDAAAEHLRAGMEMHREAGDRAGELRGLNGHGVLHRQLGRFDDARADYDLMLSISREFGHPVQETCALNGLGDVALAAGRAEDALDHYAAARILAAENAFTYEQATAHAGLGHAYRALGDTGKARMHLEQAVTLLETLGLPEADTVRADLATDSARP